MKLYKLTKDGKLIFVGDEFTCLGKAQSLSPFSMDNINNPYKIEPWEGEHEGAATSHKMCDLILFAENTREFCGRRDIIFKKYVSDHVIKNGIPYYTIEKLKNDLSKLADFALSLYKKTLPDNDYKLSNEDKQEFGWLFANDFKGWLMDQGY